MKTLHAHKAESCLLAIVYSLTLLCKKLINRPMKLKVIPTQRETVLQENELIVSKTDPTGKIVYANRTFMRISQLCEKDLLGFQHNIIRHPDMPRAVFKLLWDTLQSGDEFFGYVKNICKDGGFYWVLANVTQDYDTNGKLLGYYSVRRLPSRDAIAILSPIYKEMCQIESQFSPKEALQQSLQHFQNVLAKQGMDYQSFIFEMMRKEGYL